MNASPSSSARQPSGPHRLPSPRGAGAFPDTRWSVVARVHIDDPAVRHRALDDLCTQYRYPLYCCIRQRGFSHADADDALQDFLAALIRRRVFDKARAASGRLRDLLFTALRHFLSNWKRDHAHREREVSTDAPAPSGTGHDARYEAEVFRDDDTPGRIFERKWACALLKAVLHRLRSKYTARGKAALYDEFRPLVLGGGTLAHEQAAAIATRFQMTEVNVRVTFSRFLKDYRVLLKDEIRRTLADPADIEDEVQYLKRLFTY